MILEPGCKAPLDMLVEKEGQREGEEKQSIQSSYIRSALSTQRLASQIELCVQALFFFFFSFLPGPCIDAQQTGTRRERESEKNARPSHFAREVPHRTGFANHQSPVTVHCSQIASHSLVATSSFRPLSAPRSALRCIASADHGQRARRSSRPRPSTLEAGSAPRT